MKVVQRYECDYCHTVHRTEEDCRNCESKHVCVAVIESKYEEGEKYPLRINVRFEDGSVRSYLDENYV